MFAMRVNESVFFLDGVAESDLFPSVFGGLFTVIGWRLGRRACQQCVLHLQF